MKSWFLFVFLVLTSSSIANGESQQTDGPGGTKGLGSAPTMAPHHETQNESQSSTAAPISSLPPTPTPTPPMTPPPTPPPPTPPPPPPPQNKTSQNSTDLDVAMETANATEEAMTVTPGDAVATATATTPVTPVTTATPAVTMTTAVSTATTTDEVAAMPVPGKASNTNWGYVMLVFIIIAIIILCTVLFYLRRASGTYSFDLQRHVATNHLDQPAGTFELVYLDDLASKDQTPSEDLHPPASNGSVLLEDPGTDGEKDAPPEAPGANGLEAPPTRKSSDTTLSDAADTNAPSPSGSTTLFFSTVGEEHNENNNNPAVSSRDPFVEINLDEPAWCHQLLASPPPSSSVLPFSPFSFSSSSSSSSEHLQ